MAIVFPRDLPGPLRPASGDLQLVRSMNINRRRGGRVQVSERADPRWRLEWTSVNLGRASFQEVEAFLESLRGGLNDFLAYKWERPYPVNYPNGFAGETRQGGGAFDGTGNVDAVTATSVTISNLPSAFDLLPGDMVGLVEAGNYSLHLVMEAATAVAGVVTLSVEPHIKTNIFSSAATANFDRPKCKMMLEDYSGPRGLAPSPVSVSAIQRII